MRTFLYRVRYRIMPRTAVEWLFAVVIVVNAVVGIWNIASREWMTGCQELTVAVLFALVVSLSRGERLACQAADIWGDLASKAIAAQVRAEKPATVASPVVIDDRGVTVDGKTLCVLDCADVRYYERSSFAMVTVTLLTNDLTIDVAAAMKAGSITIHKEDSRA